ncbi:MAG TPA: AlpA family phage regulatory protein [Rhodopila sp.]|nr:AlpA family phage regulatory protein [Rhodopila sp.]
MRRSEKLDIPENPAEWPLILNVAFVSQITGRSVTSIYRDMAAGHFPPAYKAGGTTVWKREEVRAWLDNLPLLDLPGKAEA